MFVALLKLNVLSRQPMPMWQLVQRGSFDGVAMQ
jgi:hypothetical protein